MMTTCTAESKAMLLALPFGIKYFLAKKYMRVARASAAVPPRIEDLSAESHCSWIMSFHFRPWREVGAVLQSCLA